MILVFMIFVIGTCAYTVAFGQQKANTVKVVAVKKPVKSTFNSKQLYLLSTGDETTEITYSEFKKMQKRDIEYVKVLKDPALSNMYGDKGKNGVVLVVMKNTGEKRKKNKRRVD